MDPNQNQYAFPERQDELETSFHKLVTTTMSIIENVCSGQAQLDDMNLKQYRTDLDEQIESVHLCISNYFGECDRKKQKIEAKISEQIDVTDFSMIGEELCNL
ncbi:hypothetical protein GPJ56_003407 [Histomonas meleagridis]|uniref:uncharacterized protein n=1 Tax=Histomonas meleagridis TaxID=135588 RepID=UPI0035594F6A|nr:hypothetical protein GPJ56_003407 [Histomonas meleagridis]KAH0805026.1 hypothetical protein GO595_001971 [Histomonas meleagridis]